MINRDQMFEPMLAACPSFRCAWAEFCADPINQADCGEPLYYFALSALADHLIAQFKSGSIDEFPAVFQVIERWHCEGEHYVREAATVGLLEDIMLGSYGEEIDPVVFEQWLLPESRRWWDKVIRFWDGDAHALREE
jgi:hypothetical protein